MEYVNGIIIAILILFLIRKTLPTKGVREVSTNQLRNELQSKNKQYIDVRTTGEFKAHHILGFKNIPLNQLSQDLNKLSKEKEIVVICQSGIRSKNACKILKKQGFQFVTNVKGGMNAWS